MFLIGGYVETPFGKYLNRKKKEQKQAAKELGLKQPYISKLCDGKKEPSFRTAAKIVKWSKGRLSFWELLKPYKRPEFR